MNKFLFITRNYPPQIGGLESYSYNLIKQFEFHHTVYKLVLSKSKPHLVWFIPYCFLAALILVRRHAVSSIHLCDAVLAPVGVLLKALTSANISVSVHGLDITYRNRLFQMFIPWSLARLDKVICVSRSTRNQCLYRGIPAHLCRVVPNGVRPDKFYLSQPKEDLQRDLEKIVGTAVQNKTVLLTVGRLVRRKGVVWFVERIMPRLDQSFYYLIAGDGPELKRIQRVVERNNLNDRVFLLGKVSNAVLKVLYNASDIFIMANITIPDDVEGFGITVIEAGSCGLPVVASNIQGIQDAVVDGMTGYLVTERNEAEFCAAIKTMDLSKDRVRSHVIAKFDWQVIYRHYRDILVSIHP